jgi:Protein of unknown function (DUF1524)
MRLEEELVGATLSITPSNLTVEHVLPVRPAASSEWKRLFADAEQRAECQASLGNLALITPRQNDRAKNKEFGEKLEIYREAQPNYVPLRSNQDILNSTGWRAEDIRAREQRLFDIVSRIWQIDFGAQSNGNSVVMFSSD